MPIEVGNMIFNAGHRSPKMNGETVIISKDEYIDLLRCKVGAAQVGPAASVAPPSFRPGPFHSWMNREEKAEIIRLHGLGYRVGEIVKIVGRPRSTVRRYVLECGKA